VAQRKKEAEVRKVIQPPKRKPSTLHQRQGSTNPASAWAHLNTPSCSAANASALPNAPHERTKNWPRCGRRKPQRRGKLTGTAASFGCPPWTLSWSSRAAGAGVIREEGGRRSVEGTAWRVSRGVGEA
jgi:hypothetical protein